MSQTENYKKYNGYFLNPTINQYTKKIILMETQCSKFLT